MINRSSSDLILVGATGRLGNSILKNNEVTFVIYSKKNIIGQEKRVLIKKFSQHTIYGELIDSDNFLAA